MARVVRKARLSMDKAPPKLSESTQGNFAFPEYFPPKKSAGDVFDDLEKIGGAFKRFKKWLDTPDPPKPAKASHAPKPETVPPFDIQEIPAAMRKEGMPIGAKLMERWFAGRLNYSPTNAYEKAELNQNGQPYASEFYDKTIIKLDWVLKYPRAQRNYDFLINGALRSQKARNKLIEKLYPFKDQHELYTGDLAANDPNDLHRRFQFQLAEVDGSLPDKLLLGLRAGANSGVPDDLTAALGSFNFYAAIGSVRFSSQVTAGVRVSDAREAILSGIWVYVKDGYTFTDLPGKRSQYLGHWSSNGVISVPYDNVAALSAYVPYEESSLVLPYLNTPVSVKNAIVKGDVYYPIHNSDFRQWAIKHQRGGDFIVFSDRRFVPISPPIRIWL